MTGSKTKAKRCQWCSTPFESSHPSKMFCTTQCKNDFGNWCASRGKVLMPIALAWRTQRGRKGIGSAALKEMTQFLDKCAAELNQQGAQPIAKHFSKTRSCGVGITNWKDADRPRPSLDKAPATDQSD